MPWDALFALVQNSITGPVATSAIAMSVMWAGYRYKQSHDGESNSMFIKILMGAAIALGATRLTLLFKSLVG